MNAEVQAGAILDSLNRWIEARPGRGFRVAKTVDGWQATLIESERRSARGSTMADALAQIGTVAGLETTG